eukprot:867008_1
MAYWRESEPVGRDIRVSNTDLLDVAQDTTNSLEELGSGHSETSLGLPERLVENQKSLSEGEPWQLDTHGWHVYSTAPSVHGVTTRHCEHRVGKGIYSRDFKLEDVILQEDIFKLNN